MAEEWLARLRFPNADRKQIVAMVYRHMDFINVPQMRPATLKKVVARPEFEEELELHRVDCLCSNGIEGTVELLKSARSEFEKEAALPDPLLTGNDLLELGIPPGPDIGKWKEAAYEQQLEDSGLNKEDLLRWVEVERRQLDGINDPAG